MRIGNRAFSPSLNSNNEYARIYINPRDTVDVQISYPHFREGEAVAVIAQDGGLLDNGTISRIITVGQGGNIAFGYQATEEAGIYRVTLRKGATVQTLDLWVGKKLPIARRN